MTDDSGTTRRKSHPTTRPGNTLDQATWFYLNCTVLNSTGKPPTQDGLYLTIHHSRDIILKMSIPTIPDISLTNRQFQFDYTDMHSNYIK